MSSSPRRIAILVALVSGCAAMAYDGWQRSRPITLADAPSDRLACVSYSPYRLPGETPHDPTYVAPRARIEADLAALASHTGCVRTYSVQQGLAVVPEVAAQLGLKVMLGIWIGRKPEENRREIALAVDLARRYPHTVSAIVVGNEVLLRREQPPERLAEMLQEVKAATGLPVTYADVWEFWLQHPSLARDVDFVTVHMLPYWEDEPIPIEHAVDHAMKMHDRVQAAFPGKEILIGEAGWPSVGRHRRAAVPSLVNEARFLREFARAAEARGIRYNVIEAFDQPWKRGQEGAMGGGWGVYDVAAHPKFPLRGPVIEDVDGLRGPAAMLAGAALFCVVGWRRQAGGAAGGLVLAAAGAATGGALATQWRYMLASNRDAIEWAVTGGYTLAALAAGVLIAIALARWMGGAPLPALATWRMLREGVAGGDRVLGALRALFLFGAAVMSLLLVVDARYRDFPLPLHAVPAIGFALLAFARTPEVEIEERVLGAWLAAAALFIVLHERIANVHALAWAGLALAYAVPVLAGTVVRARTSAPSAKPTAAGS